MSSTGPSPVAPPSPNQKPEWRIKFDNWMVNEGPRILFVICWVAIQVGLFFNAFVFYANSPDYSNIRLLTGVGLSMARGAAAVLNFNCGIILFSVCRNIITMIRQTPVNRVVPLDKNITFHKAIAWTIAFFVAVHVCAHYFNFLNIQKASPTARVAANLPAMIDANTIAMGTVAGVTGHFLVVIMFIMYTAALETIRRKYFELFWYSHHLFVPFFAFLLAHGAQCLIQPNGGTAVCVPNTWKWVILSMFLYLIERLIREIRSRRQTWVSKVIQHPSKVYEVQMKKPSMKVKAGQYLFLNCPEVHRLEWHPFTISSAPEEDFVGVHIRIAGDWTTKFARRLGCILEAGDTAVDRPLPTIHIDGPFGTASEDSFKFEVAVLIGAGIGVTPFSSILKSIWYRVINPNTVMKLRKCYFFWICRDIEAFEWFHDLLRALEAEDIDHFLEINIFLTGGLKPDQVKNVIINDETGQDALTGLRSPTNYGRPPWDQIFGKMAEDHPSTDIGVFFCGPKPLSKQLHICCNTHTSTTPGGTKFYYHKENF